MSLKGLAISCLLGAMSWGLIIWTALRWKEALT